MRIRDSVLALAAVTTLAVAAAGTGAQAAPLPATPTVDASAPVAGAPSGKALVRIDGGDARAIQLGKHSYRLVVPADAAVRWMGEVSGKGLRAGAFSHNGLVKGWSRLGHRADVGVLTTITWGSKATLALVKRPRINATGGLAFDVLTNRTLPKELSDFSVNVTRATPRPRGMQFPLVFDPVQLSSNTQVQASAGGDYSASVAFMQQASPNVWTNCTISGASPLSANPQSLSGHASLTLNFGPMTCNDISFVASGTMTTKKGTVTVNTSLAYTIGGGVTEILGTFNFTTGSFQWQGILADILQGTNGTVACPVGQYTC